MAKQSQNTNDEIEKLVKQIRAYQTELDAIKKGLSSTLSDQSTAISDINSELDKTISAFKKIRNAQNLSLDKQTKQLEETKSLADVYKQIPDSLSSFKNKMMDTLSISQKLNTSAKAASGAKKAELESFASTYNQTLSLATELSSLNKEDTLEYGIKSNEIQKSLNLLQTQADTYALINGKENKTFQNLQKQIAALKQIVLESDSIANISKETKDLYQDLMADLEGLEKTFKKIAVTAEVFFSSFKNAAGMVLIFAGGLVDDFNKISKEIGGSVFQLTGFKAEAFAISKILGDEAAKGVTTLAEKLGNAKDVTLGLGINVGVMSGRLGVSGEEAATLVNQFGNLQGLSSDTALNTMEAASQLASANGVAPANVMKDIAENTEFFALYSKDGGANIAQAAIEARRLGVDLATASKISDNLLDYQTSVAAEMEASVLLGRNLNLNKARELAYAGDSAGAMKEALNAAGGIAEFNKMDVFQKKAVAEALGTSVSELQQMSANMEKAATPAGKLQESFNATTAFVQEMGAGIAGTAVKGIGGMLIGMKDFKGQVSDAKEGFDFMKDSVKGIGTFLGGGKGAGFTGLLDTKETGAIKSLGKGGAITPPTPGSSSTATKSASSISKIDTKALLRGAGALLVMAAALYVTAKALQEFNTVKPDSLLKAGAALLGLGLAMIGLNYALAPLAASGILELVAGSMLAFGGALALAGLGAKLFGEGFSLVSVALPSIVEQLSSLSQVNFLPIFGMAAALTALGASLALVATTGLAALPVLAGIGLAAGAVGMLFGGEEKGGGSDLLLEEIKGLRQDIQTQPITVQLDGRQVYISNLRQAKNKSN